MEKRTHEHQYREFYDAGEEKIAKIVEFIKANTSAGRIARSEAIAEEMGMKISTVSKWLARAKARSLIHFANKTKGWKCGPHVLKNPARKKATPLIVATAEVIRELANGQPAQLKDIIERLGTKYGATRRRLKAALAAGLIVSSGHGRGWWHADELPEQPADDEGSPAA